LQNIVSAFSPIRELKAPDLPFPGVKKNILHVNYADGSSCLPNLEMNSKTGLKVMKYGNRVAAQIGCGKFAWAQEARDL